MSDVPILANIDQMLDCNYTTYISTTITSPIILTLPVSSSTDGVHFDIINTSITSVSVVPSSLDTITGGTPGITIVPSSRQRLTSMTGIWYGYIPATHASINDIQYNSNGSLPSGQSVASYLGSPGGNVATTVESISQRICSRNCTLQNLIIHLTVAPGTSKSRIFIVRKNGINTGLAVTIQGTVTVDGSNTTDQVSFISGDLFSLYHEDIGLTIGCPPPSPILPPTIICVPRYFSSNASEAMVSVQMI